MDVFDTYGNVQIKVGPCELEAYSIGEIVPIPDGVYVGREGAIVILDGIFVTEFPYLISKWGDEIDCKQVLLLP